jgi:hypothetical protein
MKQKVMIMAALLHDPDVLVLDDARFRDSWLRAIRCCVNADCGGDSVSRLPDVLNRVRQKTHPCKISPNKGVL